MVVREYEPSKNDENELEQVEPNHEVKEEMADVRGQLMKLEQELAIMRQGPFGPQSEFMKALPRDEREQVLQMLAKEGVMQSEQDDLLTLAELERLAEEDEEEGQPVKQLGVTLRIPKRDQAYVRHFNKALRAAEAGAGIDVQKNLTLWIWYLRCQQQVNSFSAMITKDVWSMLWKTQAELRVRPRHLVMLAQDMLEAKEPLDETRRLSYIEALHAAGHLQRAIEVWHGSKASFQNESSDLAAFWDVGIRLHAAAGSPLKAQELAFNALSQKKINARALVPVILAWARSQDPDSLVKAWACYVKLREKAGTSMQPDLYESISNAFLDANHGDAALTVFKDMVLMREESAHDSTQIHRQAVNHFGEVLEQATTEEQVNRIGLSALLILPRQFQNRYFFTSWIKKLIGDKRIDSAAMVVELMYERGIAPDAKPLNGIIGAWLRDGSAGARRKAEAMAQSMIEARIKSVKARNTTSMSENKVYRAVSVDKRAVSIQRRVPPATIETFSILLQYLTQRQRSVEAEELTKTMINACEINPNSYILNHWLYGDLRAGRLRDVWAKYCDLKNDIQPDLETFAALWDTAKVQYSKSDPAYAPGFPSTREVFAHMVDWLNSLPANVLRRRQSEFSAELYEQIIRCFCLSTDLPGTTLAMHHLARLFTFYPTDNALRLICGQAARLLPQEGRVRGNPRSRRYASHYKPAMTQIAEIIDTIETRRKIALVDRGEDPQAIEDPTSSAAQQLRLAVLTEFACMFMQRTRADSGSYHNDLSIAARTMHVDLEGIDFNPTE